MKPRSFPNLCLLFLMIMLEPVMASAAQNVHTATINGADVITGTAIEGGLIIAQATPGSRVEIDGTAVPVSDTGLFLIGFHHQSNTPQTIWITTADDLQHRTIVTPTQRDYNIQRIDGLEPNMVTPPKEVIKRIKADSRAVRQARARIAPVGDFTDGFDWPISGPISSVFGNQRILNGKPRTPHYGIDIAAPKGTPVLAPASGRVTLVMDLYYSGWTILVAHGLGLNSSFLHLDQVAVSVGETIDRGALLGWVGSSGRSTGPHLDWRLDWQGRRLDAALIAGPMP